MQRSTAEPELKIKSHDYASTKPKNNKSPKYKTTTMRIT